MSTRKTPIKTGSESVVEELPIGYFKIEGRIVRVREAHSWEIRTPARARGRSSMRLMEETKANVRFQCRNLAPDVFLNIPLEVVNQMQIGKSYEIQCTIIERKGEVDG